MCRNPFRDHLNVSAGATPETSNCLFYGNEDRALHRVYLPFPAKRIEQQQPSAFIVYANKSTIFRFPWQVVGPELWFPHHFAPHSQRKSQNITAIHCTAIIHPAAIHWDSKSNRIESGRTFYLQVHKTQWWNDDTIGNQSSSSACPLRGRYPLDCVI